MSIRELVLHYLKGRKPEQCSAIAHGMARDFSQVSKTLKDLTDSGLVLAERAGTHTVYSLASHDDADAVDPDDDRGNRAAPIRTAATNAPPPSRLGAALAANGPGGARAAFEPIDAKASTPGPTPSVTLRDEVHAPPPPVSSEPAVAQKRQRRIKPEELVDTFQRMSRDSMTLAKLAPLIRKMNAVLDEVGTNSEELDDALNGGDAV